MWLHTYHGTAKDARPRANRDHLLTYADGVDDGLIAIGRPALSTQYGTTSK